MSLFDLNLMLGPTVQGEHPAFTSPDDLLRVLYAAIPASDKHQILWHNAARLFAPRS
jgi:predicted TIM-barrel fold metal-dependent hydrolase